ncbi:MAG: hypothetical protein A3I02_08680 [Betaproteobacteria bacterium RIFCSPLOWO2_02_FULL_67_26]|nr:MAG: hypothetical protein A3I02_08680 [Betaproteobacteria bacterium RIFCSPLOWO2_02_FULL_67_26]
MIGTRGKPGRPRAGSAPRAGLLVDEEQRRHLIEACAFFRAQRFRECAPGHYREQDVQAAASEIDAVIRPVRKRGKR